MVKRASKISGEFRGDVRDKAAVGKFATAITNNNRRAINGTRAEIRRQFKRSAKVALDDFIITIDTSGYDMPYKSDPSTLARVDTGSMRKDAATKITRDDENGIVIQVGWPNAHKKYYAYQDEGTGSQFGGSARISKSKAAKMRDVASRRGVRAMMGKAHAMQVMRQELKRRLG